MQAERSERMIYLRALGPLVLAILTLVAVSVGGFHALSASRAYVGGESLWSKSRSQAVAVLRARAAPWQAPGDCSRFDSLLDVPLGDRMARLELDKPHPDLGIARAGLLRGGNLPDDVEGMINLYLHFNSLPPIQETIAAWRHGDELIRQLQELGRRICEQPTGPDQAVRMEALLRELDGLDADLIATERRFSVTLSRASRASETVLTVVIAVLALLLATGGAWFVLRSQRAQIEQRQQLLEANNRWGLAADAAAVGVFAWTPETDVLELDARARTLYGQTTDLSVPVRRADVLGLIHPEDREEVVHRALTVADTTEPFKSRYRVFRPDGSVHFLEVTGMMRRGGPRAPPQLIGVVHDVTDEVSKAQFQIEKEAAERVARSRTEFLSRLSHELRTPLNAVLGLAQLLDMDKADPLTPRQQERMRLVLESGWHLLHLVDDVLDITSIDSGMVAIKTSPTDLAAVIQASLNLVEPERQTYDITVHTALPEHVPLVLGDPVRLQQVFVNLLSNACKYNRRGGTLTLRLHTEGKQVCVTVEDQGRGMSNEQLGELFQPFKRMQVSPDVPGTGLGLVVVKLLVGQMGGSIEVSSEPDRGTSFSVTLSQA